jgi:hypothetical protein
MPAHKPPRLSRAHQKSNAGAGDQCAARRARERKRPLSVYNYYCVRAQGSLTCCGHEISCACTFAQQAVRKNPATESALIIHYTAARSLARVARASRAAITQPLLEKCIAMGTVAIINNFWCVYVYEREGDGGEHARTHTTACCCATFFNKCLVNLANYNLALGLAGKSPPSVSAQINLDGLSKRVPVPPSRISRLEWKFKINNLHPASLAKPASGGDLYTVRASLLN